METTPGLKGLSDRELPNKLQVVVTEHQPVPWSRSSLICIT
jgi:hypothetical protein